MSDDINGLQTVYAAPSEPARALADGDRFADRYRIDKRLGGGGMGVVYLAHDELTGEPVALKLIHPSLVDTAARQRMIEEGVLARKVSHPNVVRVHDVGERDGQIYLVMEYVEGRPLRAWMTDHMSRGTNTSLEEVVRITREILAGLAAAHAQDLVHRDVKPENVMISGDPAEDGFRLKILDFGIARGLKTSALTGSQALGTPLYMAPEQKTAPDAVGPSADLYSVGRMLYEMLMDVLPEGTWNPPSEQRADVPPALDGVIRKALQPPRHRYQTVAEFTTALEAAVRGGGGQAQAPAPSTRPPEPGAADDDDRKQAAAGAPDWRGGLRALEDFDRKYNPGHKWRRQLGLGEAQRLSDMPTGKIVMWGLILLVVLWLISSFA